MTRLEGNKPNTTAIIIGAITFALVAAGLFLAFRPVAEPPQDTNAAPAIVSDDSTAGVNAASSETTANGANSNVASAQDESLTPILTPLPTATPSLAPTAMEAPAMAAPTTAPTLATTAAPPAATAAATPEKPLDLSDAPPPPIPPPAPAPNAGG